ncbi:uncharacterized protein LOC130124473 [Lampris incognitus]|uniref:uncharacterized protein LOC130124473 n=1 Tax=Lampris incognitus TaxID=2546036 RepID=UPI0024B5586A|nr:uncharacterized protein LOC130124473 [Lampris incognitus]
MTILMTYPNPAPTPTFRPQHNPVLPGPSTNPALPISTTSPLPSNAGSTNYNSRGHLAIPKSWSEKTSQQTKKETRKTAILTDTPGKEALVAERQAQANAAVWPIGLDPVRAHNFLSRSRPKRDAEPVWYRADPDFQSYYRFYNSIGHIEGLYEIDKLRMLYQQMRQLEQVHGSDASSYQNALTTTTVPPTTAAPPTTTEPPPPPTLDPLADAQVIYLCNPKDPLCKPQIVYLPTGAVPVLCDPRYNPACRPSTEEEMKAMAPPPPPPKKSLPPPPPPPVATGKGMEHDCDPYWDPDCLIDHPPRPVTNIDSPPAELVEEGEAKAEESGQKSPYAYFNPYDYNRDLFDPFSYTNPAPDPE